MGEVTCAMTDARVYGRCIEHCTIDKRRLLFLLDQNNCLFICQSAYEITVKLDLSRLDLLRDERALTAVERLACDIQALYLPSRDTRFFN
jgi:hypothetical protein